MVINNLIGTGYSQIKKPDMIIVLDPTVMVMISISDPLIAGNQIDKRESGTQT
jgi:hypothetical protein